MSDLRRVWFFEEEWSELSSEVQNEIDAIISPKEETQSYLIRTSIRDLLEDGGVGDDDVPLNHLVNYLRGKGISKNETVIFQIWF